jgi:hypothetical protein
MPALDLSYDGGSHRNRGLNSAPRAHAWINYMRGMEEWKLMLGCKKSTEEEWTDLATSKAIRDAIERAVEFLIESPPDELGDGSHIVNVMLDTDEPIECPKVGQELRVLFGSEKEMASTCVGILQIQIVASAAGSESVYLPEAYKPLYLDKSLRRAAYAKMKQMQDEL